MIVCGSFFGKPRIDHSSDQRDIEGYAIYTGWRGLRVGVKVVKAGSSAARKAAGGKRYIFYIIRGRPCMVTRWFLDGGSVFSIGTCIRAAQIDATVELKAGASWNSTCNC